MLEVREDFPLPRHCLTRWFESRGPVYLLQMTSVGLQVVPQKAHVIGMTPHWAVRRGRPRGSGGPVQWHRARLSLEVSSDSFVPVRGERPSVRLDLLQGTSPCDGFLSGARMGLIRGSGSPSVHSALCSLLPVWPDVGHVDSLIKMQNRCFNFQGTHPAVI